MRKSLRKIIRKRGKTWMKIMRKFRRKFILIAPAIAVAFLTGCATQTPASRAQQVSLENCQINLYAGTVPNGSNTVAALDTNGLPTIELLSLTMANDGSESMSMPQTNQTTPTTSLELNRAGGSQSVGSVLGDAVAAALGHLWAPTKPAQSKPAPRPANCPDGNCGSDNCTEGNCSE